MRISFQPIAECAHTQPFAECLGVDLSGEIKPQTVEILRRALLKHGLLLFRNQNSLTPEDELRFNTAFGWHDTNQDQFLFGFGAPTEEHKISGGAQLPNWPQISVLGNVTLDDYHGLKNLQLKPVLGFTYSAWHADGLHDMHDGMPELTTMYNPPGFQTGSGGETYFTSGVRAIDRMDQGLLEELQHCMVAYMRAPNDDYPDETRRVTRGPSYMIDDGTRRIGFGRNPDDPEEGLRDFQLTPEHAEGGGSHPCIRRHPVTEQLSLYVTPGKAVYLADAKTGVVRHGIDETADLLSRALRPSAIPGVRYEHRWREGDFVAWINTLVLHSASDPSDIEGPRLMHRVRLSSPKSRGASARTGTGS